MKTFGATTSAAYPARRTPDIRHTARPLPKNTAQLLQTYKAARDQWAGLAIQHAGQRAGRYRRQ